MVTVGMNYEVLAGKEEIFERAFEAVLEAMRSDQGHAMSRLYREFKAERSYLILSWWTDRAAFDRFVASEAFAKVTNWGKEQILAARPKHEVFESTGTGL